MCGSNYILIAVLISPSVFCHFIWPLSMCILADTCNHTWIPECGEEITTYTDYRLFIDECDMYEFNCDHDRKYEIANYSECFAPATGCPTHPNKFYRMGNYKFVLEGRKMVYAPTERPNKAKTTLNPPTLPMHMLKGKRRYTPEVRRRMMKKMNQLRLHTRTARTTKMMTKWKTTTRRKTTRETFVIKKVPIVKNGKKFIKVIKGFKKTIKYPSTQSDFLE